MVRSSQLNTYMFEINDAAHRNRSRTNVLQQNQEDNYVSSSEELATTDGETSFGRSEEDINESYKMAAQVAVGAAIIVALAILLALVWNSLKRRLPGNNSSRMSSSASRRHRFSSDSFDRLVEDRLRNRPPPYSSDQDKPPSYEESFHDSSIRQQVPISRNRDRRRPRQSSFDINEPQQLVHDNNRNSSTVNPESSFSVEGSAEGFPTTPNSTGTRMTTVSYENQSFNPDEQPEQSTVNIPSISMVVFENEVSVTPENDDNGIVMLHL